MLPAIGSIVFWIGVIIAAYVVLRCVELSSATGAQERPAFVRGMAVLVAVGVIIVILVAYTQHDAMMRAAASARSDY